MADDTHYMKQALLEAQKAFERGEVPVGAVVVCRDRIIARSHNLTETLNDVTAHAEMQAITAAANYLGGKYLPDCTLYVTLEPCPMCMGAALNARVDKLYFGAYEQKGRSLTAALAEANLLNHKTEVVGGVSEEKCSALLTDFFSSMRQKQKEEKERKKAEESAE